MNMIQSRPEEKSKKLCKFNPKNWQSKSCSSTHLQSPVSLLREVSSVVWHTVSSHLLNAVDLLIYFYAYNCNPQQLMSSTFWAQTVTLQLEIILFNMVHQPGTPHSLLDGACWIKEALDKSESFGRLCLNISSAKFDQACSVVGT